jgi:hypothetical protein
MNRLSYILILVAIVVLARNCGSERVIDDDVISVKTDTVYKTVHDTITKKLTVTSIKYVPVTHLTPGNNLDTCKTRFNDLLKDYSSQVTYRDTIKLDSIGTITIIDTVFRNRLGNRVYINDYKIPTVTKTITKLQEKKRQIYIGGNIFFDSKQLHTATPGILYKDKKDRVYQANVGINADGTFIYGAGMYWKIKLR